MNFLATFLAGSITGGLLMTIFNRKEMKDLTEENKCLYNENKDLRYDNDELHNAEYREMLYARIIKKIEDIIFKDGYGSIVDRIDKIKEVIAEYQSTNNF